MKHIRFYLDFISPYAYLAFEELPQALMGLSYSVTYKPLLFAALLKHHGQLGPAEIAAKRDWTYRQVQWLAHNKGRVLDMPAAHPFNPLGLLRLAVATDAQGQPNRYVCETLFKHVWVGGADAANADRLAAITQQLAPQRDPADEAVKAQLRAHAEEAIAKGVFGVPAFEVDGKVFWGLDALPMLRAYLQGDTWFDGPQWDSAGQRPAGVVRASRRP
ncbi:2-hydroxychromene-2-carboxylate isomerase [Rhodoferax sp. AJA081-3]|uniref:2-hydroxychromene-2-carboxylate isomerase n=1 Tax=Rhodoferax sp. AJA081-3 TaxID=2752316 RepID=UPI001ADF751F|nr:2-hydroxychromene-2-carboxylate isomerase [Rhodoferax sp. AJA081-3]QTN30175.1 2-hydroxychromene-2-carboxylate isomerase [Rhodoferax sp. AJA081-3]